MLLMFTVNNIAAHLIFFKQKAYKPLLIDL